MFLPFVLDPNATLNQVQKNEAKNVTGIPQIFSFRNPTLNYAATGSTGKLTICPQSYIDKMSNDISHILLYQQNGNKESINVNAIFNSIPGIQIREFLPDTRLEQTMDFFSKVIEILLDSAKAAGASGMSFIKDMFNKDSSSNASQSQASNDGITDKITRVCTFIKNYLTGVTTDNFYSDTFKNYSKPLPLSSCKNFGDLTTYIYKFPYTMWYQLQSCTTTNIYELPCLIDGKMMYASDGSLGWPGTTLGFGKTFGDGIVGKLMGMTKIGGMVSSLLGNLNVSVTPWWDAREGIKTAYPDVVVKFDLFNDTAYNALFNFIFVNTIVPNNKWVQYNLFQHSPHLYDIKVEGSCRLYACTAKFKVSYDGVLRDMPDAWIDTCLKPRINSCMSGQFISNIKSNRLIKIPDIYHVEMTFSSLIPDQFNNFLFAYSENANITTEYKNGPARFNSIAADLLKNGLTSLADKTKKVWNGEMNEDGE